MFLQETFAAANWYERSGSPESFTPLMRLRPLAGAPAKKLLFQTAYGDQTVPNPTTGNIYRSGQLFDLVTYYRNDKSLLTYSKDPHGFLADPTIAGRTSGELQLGDWLKSAGTSRSSEPLFEVPIVTIGNLDCLHYRDPQTGLSPAPQPNPATSTECSTMAADLNGGWLAPIAIPGGGGTPKPSPSSAPGATPDPQPVTDSALRGAPNTAAVRLPWIPAGLVGAGLLVALAGWRRRKRV